MAMLSDHFTDLSMSRPLHLESERYFPSDANVRAIAVRLFSAVQDLPIISPH